MYIYYYRSSYSEFEMILSSPSFVGGANSVLNDSNELPFRGLGFIIEQLVCKLKLTAKVLSCQINTKRSGTYSSCRLIIHLIQRKPASSVSRRRYYSNTMLPAGFINSIIKYPLLYSISPSSNATILKRLISSNEFPTCVA